MKKHYLILFLAILSFSSCKKEGPVDNLSNVILKREGLLRVECKKCEINYQVYNKEYKVGIESGSNDIPFFYSGDFDLKTQVLSKEDQKIRLIVIDSFGRIVSNELNAWSQGEVRNKTFVINTK